MKNAEVFVKNPLQYDLINNGVSKVAEVGTDPEQIKTLRFELETFVCDGEYARGLERILYAYLDGLNKPEQQAAWVSGFFGSGKSHLVKMLRYLWVDYKFPDGASARSIAQLPGSIKDLFVELTNRSNRYGGLKAVAGTLGAGNTDNVRLAFLQLIFRAAGLPENLAAARFVLWLREKQLWDKFANHLKTRNLDVEREIRNFYVSTPLAEALVAVDSTYGNPQNAQAAIRSQFPANYLPTVGDLIGITRSVFSEKGQLPCTLVVVDEVQQYIGDKVPKAMDIQELAEHCCRDLNSRLMLVATGQSALTGTASLSRLQARFTVKASLSDTDVENVIRKTILAKKPERNDDIKKVIDANQGEISRHLRTTRLASSASDSNYYTSDYPLLPTRLRFWAKVLRNVDASGTTAQLRTQLKIIFDAARLSADKPLGSVVPADFVYDQISTDLLNTGIIQREYYENILSLRDKTPSGTMKSRLCALMFLISQLPRSSGADDGVRATPETLADLLVEDLSQDGAKLRQEVPGLLQELVTQGKVMQIEDNEYVLQTLEGARWTHEYAKYYANFFKDDIVIGDEREKLLGNAIENICSRISLTQGTSKIPRKMGVSLSAACPTQPSDELVLWMRHGWAEQEKTIEADARTAGNSSPMLFGFLPRVAHDELKQYIATKLAAEKTIEMLGVPTQPLEAVQSYNSMKTRSQGADVGIQRCVSQVLTDSKIFLGGGNEITGLELIDKIKSAAANVLPRLFSEFNVADHANWSIVLNNARSGNIGALSAVGYQGETVRHPACKKIYDFIGTGKKGKEVRDSFKDASFGWPQDAIDASLVMLTLSGNLRVTINGQQADAKLLNQTQIGNAYFQVDIPPLTVSQRLDLKALFQKMGVSTQNNQESAAAAIFLPKLLELAQSAGGDPPQPAVPSVQLIRDFQTFSGNSQLLEIHKNRDTIIQNITDWNKTKDDIGRQLPRWERLKELYALAAGLVGTGDILVSANAVESSRALLQQPDPIAPLIQKTIDILRSELNNIDSALQSVYQMQKTKLEINSIWQRLSDEQKKTLITQFNLGQPAAVKVATEEEIIATLQENSLANRRTLIEALPQRFQRALEEATRILEPKATRISLPPATIRNEKELEDWLNNARQVVVNKLKDGPVIL